MNEIEDLTNQKQIIHILLGATLRDYAGNIRKRKGDIIIGARGSVLSYRDFSTGFLAGVIARSVLPTEEGVPCEEAISLTYPVETLMAVDVFELHSFHKKECAFLSLKKEATGVRKEFHVYPDTAQDGLLIRLEWNSGGNVQVLTTEDIIDSLKTIYASHSSTDHPGWKPEVWFNGVRVPF